MSNDHVPCADNIKCCSVALEPHSSYSVLKDISVKTTPAYLFVMQPGLNMSENKLETGCPRFAIQDI